MARVVVDPITRIEGHLRIEVEVKDGKIQDAYSSATMWRGLEKILVGRDPRDAWAFTQRICGVCTTVHAFASVRAVEDALAIDVPPLAQAIRNLMIASQSISDHVMHFYHLHALDWVNVPNALKADPAETSRIAQAISPWPKSSPGYFSDLKAKLKGFVESGQLGIFANAYWEHPGYRLPAAVDLLAVAHYLEALDWQRHIARIHTYIGGKNPHPNFLVGGVPTSVNLDSPSVLNNEVLSSIGEHVRQARAFVEQVYIPDILAIAPSYLDWAKWGDSGGNFMSYGEFPSGQLSDTAGLFLPRGAILNHDLGKVLPVDPKDPEQVQEAVAHSWYKYSDGDNAMRHPAAGETEPNYTGPTPPYDYLHVDGKYSWLKSPRWRGNAMEVGPLARMLIAYASGHKPVADKVNHVLKRLDVPAAALFSTLGRTAARAVETWVMADYIGTLYDHIIDLIKGGNTATFNPAKWDPASWPKQARGMGPTEAPRGALGHWVEIDNGLISGYQCIVPSTWNGGPRDAAGKSGPYETALKGTPIARNDLPLEILRTVHSFDPCMACAAHVYDPDGKKVAQIKIR